MISPLTLAHRLTTPLPQPNRFIPPPEQWPDQLSVGGDPFMAGKPHTLGLTITNAATGQPVSNLAIVHEKPAHMFLVNQDLSRFYHVHPAVKGPGVLQVPVQFADAGRYKAYLQITTPEKGEQVLKADIPVYGKVKPAAPLIPDAEKPKTVNGITYRLRPHTMVPGQMSMITVDIIGPDGKPVTRLTPYLGAPAHGVIISQDQQTFAHVHPVTGQHGAMSSGYGSPVMFHTVLTKPGLYKLWVQTMIDGQLNTVVWTFRV